MDLRKFYLETINEKDYYYKFFDLINDINKVYNVFEGVKETNNYDFNIFDADEAIEKFRFLCLPENENHDKENQCWFYLILFYLNKCGYIIEEFPKIIERPPTDPFEFVNRQIRNRIISEGKAVNGKVQYSKRRVLVSKLTFVQKDNHIELDDGIEKKFTEISNRQATFQNMSTDEKLAEIANLIEYMLKKNGKFLTLDYSKICFDYIDNDKVKNLRGQLQCFRHSSEDAIKERESFTKEQKTFLVDFGLTIIKVIHAQLQQ